jgi:hypothetical protein
MSSRYRHHHSPSRWLAGILLAVLLFALAACTSGSPPNNPGQQPGTGQAPASPPTDVRGDLVGLVLTNGTLAREGGGVTLRFTVANQGEEAVTIGDLLGPGGLSPSTFEASGVYLYDGAARKRYDVVRDGNACRCSKVPLGIDPGQTLQLFASFPEPAQASELSAIVPHFPPLDGMRIQG